MWCSILHGLRLECACKVTKMWQNPFFSFFLFDQLLGCMKGWQTLTARPCLGLGPQLASGLGRKRATLFALALLPAPWALLKLAFSSGCLASSLPAAAQPRNARRRVT